jgi:hypothetical protein
MIMNEEYRKQILGNLEIVNKLLFKVQEDLLEVNKTSQFDYCTNAELAHKVDGLERMSRRINKIVYQK